jgi:hypothetical protein
MTNHSEHSAARQEKKSDTRWWEIQDLIFGVAETAAQIKLLSLVYRYTHRKKGFAWASQETLAAEMRCDTSTVERAFSWAKNLGVIGVRRVRTGKGKADQFNEYWLELERLKELQPPAKKPKEKMGEHPASVLDAGNPKHPASVRASTPHRASKHPARMREY